MALALVGMPIAVLSTETIGSILDGGACGLPRGRHPDRRRATPSIRSSRSTAWWRSGLVHPEARQAQCGRPGRATRLVLGKPIGVGVMSAALKKDELDAEGYARMIASTTRAEHARAGRWPPCRVCMP
jgi:selenide,water dikinase